MESDWCGLAAGDVTKILGVPFKYEDPDVMRLLWRTPVKTAERHGRCHHVQTWAWTRRISTLWQHRPGATSTSGVRVVGLGAMEWHAQMALQQIRRARFRVRRRWSFPKRPSGAMRRASVLRWAAPLLNGAVNSPGYRLSQVIRHQPRRRFDPATALPYNRLRRAALSHPGAPLSIVRRVLLWQSNPSASA